jgi:uncharacterized membrane protein YcaP (DUF421 family)
MERVSIMINLHDEVTLPVSGWIIRAIIGFIYMIVISRCLGQRSISQLRLLDFVIVLMIGDIIANPLSDDHVEIQGALITIGITVGMYVIATIVTYKTPRFRKFVSPEAIPLVTKGQINFKNLKKARLTIDDLLSELRKNKIDDVSKVVLANWEPGGVLSVFQFPQYDPVTKEELNVPITAFIESRAVIKDGIIDNKALYFFDKNDTWLKQKLMENYSVSIEEVLLATLSEKGEVKIYLYK